MTTAATWARLKKVRPFPKKEYKKASFDLKLNIIDRIQNGQISVNHTSEVYQISRNSINFWMQK